MNHIKFVDTRLEATNGADWKHKNLSNQKQVIHNGIEYSIIARETKNVSTIKRICYIILNTFSLGILAYVSKFVQNICFKGKYINDFAIPQSVLINESEEKFKQLELDTLNNKLIEQTTVKLSNVKSALIGAICAEVFFVLFGAYVFRNTLFNSKL